MRWTFAVIVLAGGLLPWLLLDGATPDAQKGPSPRPRAGLGRPPLVVASRLGLQLSYDDGRTWVPAAGLPARGTLQHLVVDPTRAGTAYASNGDVYVTSDGGRRWRALAHDPGAAPAAGVSALAIDPATHILYAGGSQVDAYDPASGRWRAFGRAWPSPAVPSILLAGATGDVYAAAGTHLYHCVGSNARWRAVSVAPLRGAPITALALGADRQALLLAAGNRGVWFLDHKEILRPLGSGFPDTITNALAVDPGGSDVFAATSLGLLVSHQDEQSTAGQYSAWHMVIDRPGDPIVALLASSSSLTAVTQGGSAYIGVHTRWQSLTWQQAALRVPADLAPLGDALSAGEWHALTRVSPLPPPFRNSCLAFGPNPDQTFDVCGPFREFYVLFKYPVLGWPRQRAYSAGGVIRQAFDNVVLQWTRSRGVTLAPLPRSVIGSTAFPKPRASMLSQATTAVVDGYYVDPLFYSFWRQAQYHQVSIFGPPISQVLIRPSTDGSGQMVPVQYFRNARLEYHASGGFPIRVSAFGGR
jgi:hypothetical protein